jgi:Tfp pilus assembly protein PilE
MGPGNAKVDLPEPRATTWDVWLAVAGLLAVVALGTWAIYWVKRWREEAVEAVTLSHAEQLERYQKMVDDGDLAPDEFARIKAHLEMRAAQTPPPANQPPDTSIQE